MVFCKTLSFVNVIHIEISCINKLERIASARWSRGEVLTPLFSILDLSLELQVRPDIEYKSAGLGPRADRLTKTGLTSINSAGGPSKEADGRLIAMLEYFVP